MSDHSREPGVSTSITEPMMQNDYSFATELSARYKVTVLKQLLYEINKNSHSNR